MRIEADIFFYQLAKRVSTIKYRHQIFIFLFVCSFFYFPLHSTLSSSSLCLFSLFSSLTLPLLLFTLSPRNTLSLLVTVLIITAYLQSNKTCATLWIPSYLDTTHPYPIHLHYHHLDHLHRHLLVYCLQSHASFSSSSSLGVHCSHSFVLRCTSQEIHDHNSGTVQKKKSRAHNRKASRAVEHLSFLITDRYYTRYLEMSLLHASQREYSSSEKENETEAKAYLHILFAQGGIKQQQGRKNGSSRSRRRAGFILSASLAHDEASGTNECNQHWRK